MNTDSILKQRISVEHMALTRGWVQGIELRSLADRYLAGLGDDDGDTDLRQAKSTLQRVLSELATTATAHGIDDAKVLSRQASRIKVKSAAPSLEDFAEAENIADFYNESELALMYAEKYENSSNKAARGFARRTRLVERQMRLIQSLQPYVGSPMSLGDPVIQWFEDSLAIKFISIGIRTIEDLCFAIAQAKTTWCEHIQGVGVGKAERIRRFLISQRGPLEDWLKTSEAELVAPRRRQGDFRRLLDASALPSVYYAPSSDPADEIKVVDGERGNTQLDGSHGALRGDHGRSATGARNDLEAVETWLKLKASPKTVALYRREIQRLMMWAIREQRKPLSSLTIEDALAYRQFLANVPSTWISKKGTPQLIQVAGGEPGPDGAIPFIDNPEWTPFAGSLTPSSAKKTLSIVHNFFAWAKDTNYCIANPFVGVKTRKEIPYGTNVSTSASDEFSLEHVRSKESSQVRRTLTLPTINAVETVLNSDKQDSITHRARFVFHLALMTGLRISEIAAARRDHMERIEPTETDQGGWILRVIGKRDKLRQVPLPKILIAELSSYLNSRFLPTSLSDVDPGVFLVGKLPPPPKDSKKSSQDDSTTIAFDPGDGVRPQTIHRILVELFNKAVQSLDETDSEAAKELRNASAHWLRHTCATRSVEGGVPLDVVAATFGHASLTTTSLYIHTEDRRKIKEMQRYWDKQDGQKT